VKLADRQGLIIVAPGADPLAGMMADAAAYPGKGVILLEEPERFLVFAFIDQGNVALDADMGGAGGLAGGAAPLGDGIRPGDGLGIFLVYRLARGKPLVVFVGDIDGADLGAFPAGGALVDINVAGLLADAGGKMSGFAFQPQNFRPGFELDV